MGDLRFPASLKPIVSKGYSQTRGSNIWRVDTQGGVPRQGRDTYFEPVPISVTLVVSSLGRQAFYSFLNNIHGGADSFIMPHDTGLGIEDHQILITSTINDSTDDGLNWVLSFTATAERTAIQEDNCLTANLPDLFGCYGDCLGGFLKAYGVYATTFPRVWESEPIFEMRTTQLDPRITYSRSGPFYYLKQGNSSLILANDGEWPLEYFGGFNNARSMPEAEATNLLPHSATFSTWSAINATKTNAADNSFLSGINRTIITATWTNFPRLSITAIPVTNGDYTLTYAVRAGSTNFIYGVIERVLTSEPSGNIRFYTNLSTGDTTFTRTSGGPFTVKEVTRSEIINGWYLLIIRMAVTGLSQISTFIGPSNALGAITANIGDSISVGLAQFERSDNVSSPIVTQSAPVTRPEVTASVPKNLHTGLRINTSAGVVTTDATSDPRIKIPLSPYRYRSGGIQTMEYIG